MITEESRKKMRDAKLRYYAKNPERKKEMSEQRKRWHQRNEHPNKRKLNALKIARSQGSPVRATQIKTGLTFDFSRHQEAAYVLTELFGKNFSRSKISAVCRGDRMSHLGFKFENRC